MGRGIEERESGSRRNGGAGEGDALRPSADSISAALSLAVDPAAVTSDDTTSVGPVAVIATKGLPEESEVSWDIDVASYVTHDRVEYYVDRFTGEARDRVVAWLDRGLRYEPMIRSTFHAAGIPEDMYYLGLVESGYDPHAYSRAAAVGIWQFMTSTAKGMGLRVDWWIDERRDPVKSTVAAARFLSGLREQFGSLYLAAAAYNGGPARVSRGLTRYAGALEDTDGDDRFFVLADRRALRSETSNYVPQLIAAALIGKNPAHYGITLDSVAPFAYDSVWVPPATPLAVVARATATGLQAIRDLNPQILRGMTPPGDSAVVRVPVGSAAVFESGFAQISDSERVAVHRVTAKKGATVTGEAKKAGITVTQLRWYNPKLPSTRSGRLSAGQTVLVPEADVVAAAFDVPDPAVARYGSTSAGGIHIVRHGESLSGIAVANHTTVATLMRLNGLHKSLIYPGQAIAVRAGVRRSARKKS